MTNRSTRTVAVFAAVAALGIGGGIPAAMARHGADDPAGHDAGDDHGAHEIDHRGRAHEVRHHHRHHHGHHHRRHHDDGPNHT